MRVFTPQYFANLIPLKQIFLSSLLKSLASFKILIILIQIKMSELALQRIHEAKQHRLTRLDLGKCGLTELPDELFE
jgi:hypothetical protein